MKRKNTTLVVLVSMILTFMFVACSGKSPADIEMSMWKQVQKGNYEDAMEILVKNSMRSEDDTPEKQREVVTMFAEKVKASCEEKGGIKDIKLLEESISEDGNTALVTLEITYKNGSTKEERSKYKKVDGDWKIDMSK